MDSYCDDVNDWLTVGGDVDLASGLTGRGYEDIVAELLAHNVTHVIDLRIEYEDRALWESNGLPSENYLHAPITDSRSLVPDEEWFLAVEDFVRAFWIDSYAGDRLYVHCQMGVNRGPSAAMLALLTVDPLMHPLDAFLRIRKARPCAGVVYAKHVGARHLLNTEGWTAEDLAAVGTLPVEVQTFTNTLQTYWTPERVESRRKIVSSFFRSLDTAV